MNQILLNTFLNTNLEEDEGMMMQQDSQRFCDKIDSPLFHYRRRRNQRRRRPTFKTREIHERFVLRLFGESANFFSFHIFLWRFFSISSLEYSSLLFFRDVACVASSIYLLFLLPLNWRGSRACYWSWKNEQKNYFLDKKKLQDGILSATRGRVVKQQ